MGNDLTVGEALALIFFALFIAFLWSCFIGWLLMLVLLVFGIELGFWTCFAIVLILSFIFGKMSS